MVEVGIEWNCWSGSSVTVAFVQVLASTRGRDRDRLL